MVTVVRISQNLTILTWILKDCFNSIYSNNDKEVDFIIDNDGELTAIEVKSERRGMNSGLPAFVEAFHPKRAYIVGTGGVSLEDFLSCDIESLLSVGQM